MPTGTAVPKQLTPWKPGQSGNPAGRRPGTKEAIARTFITDVLAEWKEHGADAVSKMREANPGDFVKMVASLLPKDVNLNVNDVSEYSDAELIERIRDLSRTAAPFLSRVGDVVEGGGEARSTAALPN